MKKDLAKKAVFTLFFGLFLISTVYAATVTNPIIWADVPDVSMIRVGDKYYMSSTTMHMNPGVPIMESDDMVHWKTVSYCYSTLVNNDKMNLNNGQNAYGAGSWASSIRYKDGTFYVLTFSSTSGSSHLYRSTSPAGPWTETKLPQWHDPSLLLDDDGRNYVLHGGGDIRIIELNSDLTGVKNGGLNKVLLTDPASVAGSGGLRAEGTQVYKHNGYYYIFNICWPSGSMRTQICSRGQSLNGSFEKKVVLRSSGVAQGSILQMKDNNWMGYLFQDNGSVGRCPWLVPVTWQDNWPVFNNGVAPSSFNMPYVSSAAGTGVVTSDDFSGSTLKLEWQWNHNPVNTHWSLTERPGFFRIKTSRASDNFVSARNLLTQRTFGPKSSARTCLDVSGLKDGDCAGLGALQAKYGFVGVKKNGTTNTIVMHNGATQVATAALNQNTVYLRIDMDFTNRTDKATFFYSLNGTSWTQIGNTLQMSYDMPHFMGYRFALFIYATKSTGGIADFDWYKVGSSYTDEISLESGYRLSVNITGKGTVSRSPDKSGYEENTPVTLTAQAEDGYVFKGWSGDGISSSENPLTITMNSDKTVNALFARSTADGNLVLNGDFSSGTEEWTLNVWDGAATASVVSGECRINITETSEINYQIQLVQPGLFLEQGKSYRVSFDAFASADRDLEVNVEMAVNPWTSYLDELKRFSLTTTKQTFSFVFTMEAPTDANGRLGFNFGTSSPAVTLDNISVKEYDPTNSTAKIKSFNSSVADIKCKNSVLQIRLPAYKNKSVRIDLYDMKGNLVRSVTHIIGGAGVCVQNLSNLPDGSYILNITSGNSIIKTSSVILTK
ncbi:MAG TPA: family 43 glycosylhydrolase [Chitinispirillaceae bacterium]|jgi:beta-xylosidase|nr:family 43 glycosylhydrolase [Chitinispirillaceae bacterium]